ncbi:hypothetical protein L7F22_047519 [Adiantum nelumboides]|nr:hypothetical protein [Adiantum nelumboides]
MGCFSVQHERKSKYRQNASVYPPPQSLTSEGLSCYPSPAPFCGASRHDFEFDTATSRPSPLHSASFQLTTEGASLKTKQPNSYGDHDPFAEDPAVGRCSSYGYGDERFAVAHSSPSASFVEENEQGGAVAHLFPLPRPPATSMSSSTSLNTCSDDASSHSISSTGSSSSLTATVPFGTCATPARADSQPVRRWHPSPLPLPPPPQSSAVLREFSHEELAGACLNFAPEFFIREGGAGPVFRAVIKNIPEGTHTKVAITRLTQGLHYNLKEWKFEVASLSRLSHRHLCKVVGFSREDSAGPLDTVPGFTRERLLVYEHLANGSLESLLYGRKQKAPLDWGMRLKIAMGAAQGLAYLHDRRPRQVIFKSFKTLNIQADLNFDAKLSDYGFARNYRDKTLSNSTSSFAVLDAYVAPETRSLDELSTKSNVWSFGIVLLELLTGRQNMDDFFPPEERNLLHWCRPYLLDSKRLYLIMDPELKGRYPTGKAKMVADLALHCLSEDPIARPSMRDVAATLCSMVGGNVDDGKADYVPASAQESVADSRKRSESYNVANGTGRSRLIAAKENGNNYGSRFKLSKSHSLVSVLASPARVFVRSGEVSNSGEAHGRSQRTRLMGFLSGEMSKGSSCGSWARDHPVLSRSYGFLSGPEVGMMMQDNGSKLLRSPFSQDCYLPPPLGRSISSSRRLAPISS